MKSLGKSVSKFVFLTMVLANSERVIANERAIAAEKLLTYCRACHGLGNLRFLPSTDVGEIWRTLTTEKMPNSDLLWKEGIIATLSWPNDVPPSSGSVRLPGKEWMPKGVKRLEIAAESIESESVRSFLLRVLKASD